MSDINKDEVILRVENLKQYFKNGSYVLKAVDDVNFEIKKGEVFGLVGESGCGKTTTGRSIIKLYNITGGSVYFKGQRICAGTQDYKDVIANARADYKEKLNKLKQEKKEKLSVNPENSESINNEFKTKANEAAAVLAEIVSCESKKIEEAKFDNNNCNKIYAETVIKRDREEFAPFIKELEDKLNSIDANDTAAKEQAQAALNDKKAELEERIKFDKKERIMNQIQMIFQDPIASLNPRMTVREIIAEGLIIRGFKNKQVIADKVAEVLKLVGLVPEHANRYPHEFSGGQRQRIGIARAFILKPEFIIADEPISALDVSIQAQVINLLNDLRRELGLTIMFIAHDLSVVKYFSDRIAVMYFGKIVELASSDELFLNPMHPYTKSLLSAIPLPDPKREKIRKRISYNPMAEHDYSVNKPEMHEVKEGHFVYCNDEELEKIKLELK